MNSSEQAKRRNNILRMAILAFAFFCVPISSSPAHGFDGNKVVLLNKSAEKYYAAGELDLAERAYLDSLKELAVGSGHEIEISKVLSNLAVVKRDQQKYSTSNTYFEKAYALKVKYLGPSNPSTQLTLRQWNVLRGRLNQKPPEENNRTEGGEEEERYYTSRKSKFKTLSIAKIYWPPTASEKRRHHDIYYGSDYEVDSKAMASSYSLDWRAIASLRKAGDTLIETGNGILLATSEDLDDQVWREGLEISLAKHPFLRFPSATVTIVNGENEGAAIAVRVLAKN